jgi:hypothetical protein
MGAVLLLLLAALVGSPSSSTRQMPVPTPIGVTAGYRVQPATTATRGGDPVGGFICRIGGGRGFPVHVELFVHGRALLLPAGIGIAAPFREADGTVTPLGCTYPFFTIDPTGVVEVTAGGPSTLADVFRIWGQPLTRHRLLGFRSRRPLTAFVDGRRWHGDPRRIALRPRSEIVVELGRLVAPHSFYLFPAGA